jgi:diguanylate cyclase (GGDEF)-like protein
MMIDIDNLKEINDTHGHKAGDDVLKLAASLLQEITRGSDLVARWGGDEFLVYLSEVDDSHLLDVGEKVRLRIEEESKKTYPITVSIGIAHTRLDDDPRKQIQNLIEKSDYCLYQAKQYRNQVVIMHEQKAHLQ